MIKEIIVTPEHEAIEDAADFIGIEPESMAAAIGLYKNHTRSVLTTVPDEAIVKRVAKLFFEKKRELDGVGGTWDNLHESRKHEWLEPAKAAIAAMGQHGGRDASAISSNLLSKSMETAEMLAGGIQPSNSRKEPPMTSNEECEAFEKWLTEPLPLSDFANRLGQESYRNCWEAARAHSQGRLKDALARIEKLESALRALRLGDITINQALTIDEALDDALTNNKTERE